MSAAVVLLPCDPVRRFLEELRGEVVGGWLDPDFATVEDGLTVVDRRTLATDLRVAASPLTAG
jgi:hypothetical protein